MLAVKLDALPDIAIQRVLVLRTARAAQVQWALEQLRAKYSSATFAVLGTQLRDNHLFEEMRKFEIQEAWLRPSGFRPFKREIRSGQFDLAVMVLNGDRSTGYEDVSRVMKRIPAGTKLVAGYNRSWYAWNHASFSSGFFVQRWLCQALEYVVLGLAYAWLFSKSSRPSYMPTGQGRRAPGYEQ
jgi:hypothetical protein